MKCVFRKGVLMKRIAVFIMVFWLCLTSNAPAATNGWADENGGVTGGQGGAIVTVDNFTDLETYAEADTPYIIQVSGTIDIGTGNLEITANKTIIGLGSDATLMGNVGFSNREGNIILENLNITNPHSGSSYDGISLKQDIYNVLVTKCTFYDTGDGAFDISGESDFVTVSWCKFYYTPSTPDPGHVFACLVGSSDKQTEDADNLHVTYHHNWWTTGVKERMPRVRYGQVHVYNNYYSDLVAGGYCVGVGCGSRIRLENNYFNAVPNPWKDYYTGTGYDVGHIGWNTGNVFYGCTEPTWATNEYATIFTPPYDYTLQDAEYAASLVPIYAGAGTPYPPEGDFDPPAAPGGLVADAGNAVVDLDWNDNSETDLAGYNVYRSTTSGGGYIKLNTTKVSDSEYTDETAANGVTYFYVVEAVDLSANNSDFSNEVFATPIDLNYYGDTNGDLFIDITDLSDFLAIWLESDCLTISGWDINDDCVVDYDEFSLLASHWMLDTVAPDTPTNLSAESGVGEVLLIWDENGESDLARYNVYRSPVSGSGYVQINTTTAPEYTDTDVVNGTTYYYVVTAVDNASNESDHSEEISAIPGALNPTITIQEYETGFCSSVGDGDIQEIATEYGGYTGSGFTNTFNAAGVGINYSVNILASGTYTFLFRYAGTSSRPADLIIDNVTAVEDIAFPSTGDWAVWNTTAVDVTLSAGVKTIRLEATSSSGLANIDYMEISGTNLQPADCP